MALRKISEVLPDALQEMRELWKHFDLNNSEGAGMKITYDNGEVRSYGQVADTSEMDAFSAIPGPEFSVHLASRNARAGRRGDK
jgi:hypothetical protein